MKQQKLEKIRTALSNIALSYKIAWRISKKTFFFGLLDDVVLTNIITYTRLYLVKLLVDLITRASVGEEPNFANKLLLLCFAVFFVTLFSSVYSNYLTVFRQKMDAESNERMQNLIIRKAAVIKMEYFEQNDFYDRFNRARSMASRNTLRVFNYTNNFLNCLISAITAAVILFSNRIWIAGAVIVIESVYILLWVKIGDIVINEARINTPEMRKLDFLSGLFAQKPERQRRVFRAKAKCFVSKHHRTQEGGRQKKSCAPNARNLYRNFLQIRAVPPVCIPSTARAYHARSVHLSVRRITKFNAYGSTCDKSVRFSV